jgi:hypothetical protein
MEIILTTVEGAAVFATGEEFGTGVLFGVTGELVFEHDKAMKKSVNKDIKTRKADLCFIFPPLFFILYIRQCKHRNVS